MVGHEFADLKSLTAVVAQSKNSNFVKFYKRDSRTVGQSMKMYARCWAICPYLSGQIMHMQT